MTGRARAARAAVLSLALGAVAAMGVEPARGQPAPSQDAQVTTTTAAEERPALLVPGDGTEGADRTTTTLGERRISRGGPSDGTLFSAVVAGLCVMTLTVGLLTWRYWRATTPPEAPRSTTGRPAR